MHVIYKLLTRERRLESLNEKYIALMWRKGKKEKKL
jgi:hypothetical protein